MLECVGARNDLLHGKQRHLPSRQLPISTDLSHSHFQKRKLCRGRRSFHHPSQNQQKTGKPRRKLWSILADGMLQEATWQAVGTAARLGSLRTLASSLKKRQLKRTFKSPFDHVLTEKSMRLKKGSSSLLFLCNSPVFSLIHSFSCGRCTVASHRQRCLNDRPRSVVHAEGVRFRVRYGITSRLRVCMPPTPNLPFELRFDVHQGIYFIFIFNIDLIVFFSSHSHKQTHVCTHRAFTPLSFSISNFIRWNDRHCFLCLSYDTKFRYVFLLHSPYSQCLDSKIEFWGEQSHAMDKVPQTPEFV